MSVIPSHLLKAKERSAMHSRRPVAVMLLLFLSCCLPVPAQTIRLGDSKDFEAFLDPIIVEQMNKLHIPGVTIAVVKDGQLFFSKGYGYADLTAKTPVSPDKTMFRIGSITKVFTATALVQLAERRKINLQDGVDRYVKGFNLQAAYTQPITFDHLLTHTAGFDEINLGRKTTTPDKVIPLGEFLKARLIRRKPPGGFISYSTYGITLAGYLVQEISKTDFREYLVRNIFLPLGMNRSSVGAVPPNLLSD